MGSRQKGSETKTNQTQKYDPPDWAQGAFQRAAKDAINAYNRGAGANPYPGQWVPDLSDQTKRGIDAVNKGVQQYDNSHLNHLSQDPTASSANLGGLASGGGVGGNKNFNDALQNALDKAATHINSSLSGAGRYGSGAQNAILSDRLGKITSDALSNQYNQDINHMLDANRQIDQSNQNQLNSSTNFFRGQSDAARTALDAGGAVDRNNQAKADAERDRWNAKDNNDWNRLKAFLDAARGAAGSYGTRTTQSTTNKTPGFWDIFDKFINPKR